MSDDMELQQEESRSRVIDLARAAGMLPELVPTKSRIRAITVNPEHWKFKAAKLRFGWDDESPVTQAEFDAAIAAVSEVLAR